MTRAYVRAYAGQNTCRPRNLVVASSPPVIIFQALSGLDVPCLALYSNAYKCMYVALFPGSLPHSLIPLALLRSSIGDSYIYINYSIYKSEVKGYLRTGFKGHALTLQYKE